MTAEGTAEPIFGQVLRPTRRQAQGLVARETKQNPRPHPWWGICMRTSAHWVEFLTLLKNMSLSLSLMAKKIGMVGFLQENTAFSLKLDRVTLPLAHTFEGPALPLLCLCPPTQSEESMRLRIYIHSEASCCPPNPGTCHRWPTFPTAMSQSPSPEPCIFSSRPVLPKPDHMPGGPRAAVCWGVEGASTRRLACPWEWVRSLTEIQRCWQRWGGPHTWGWELPFSRPLPGGSKFGDNGEF